jgi:prolyl-tRNA editing enzyme YbaK/EbsC (Cys-tRNA(Pro) deacylase)
MECISQKSYKGYNKGALMISEQLRTSAQRVQDVLDAYGLGLVVIEFPAQTRTAQQAADVIGCELGQIAKSLLFKGKKTGQPILVIASGKNRVSEKVIQENIGEEIEKADAAFVLEQTGFAIGGVPPIGHVKKLHPFIDQDLLSYPEIWAAAGTPFAVFKLLPSDLVKITQGHVIALQG